MKTEEEWIARYQITINGKTQRLTVTSNTKETELLKREILDDQERIMEAKKVIEVQQNKILEAEKVKIEKLPI